MAYQITLTGETWESVMQQVSALSLLDPAYTPATIDGTIQRLAAAAAESEAAPLRGSRGKFAGSTPGIRPKRERKREGRRGIADRPLTAVPAQEPESEPESEPEPGAAPFTLAEEESPEPANGIMLAEVLEYAKAYQQKHGGKALRAILDDFAATRVSNLRPDQLPAFTDALLGHAPLPEGEDLLK